MSYSELLVIPYNIEKHGEQVQLLLDKYLKPTYLDRMGLRADEVTEKDCLAEDILDSRGVFAKKFEGCSFVVVNKWSRVLGCQLNYYVKKEQFKSDFVDSNFKIMNDYSYKESVRKYCQHRYALCRNWLPLFRTFNMRKLLYLETVLFHPDIRGLKDNKLMLEIVKRIHAVCDKDCGVLLEMMWPLDKFIKYNPLESSMVVGDVDGDGYVLIERTISYDKFVIPVLFKPPEELKKSKL